MEYFWRRPGPGLFDEGLFQRHTHFIPRNTQHPSDKYWAQISPNPAASELCLRGNARPEKVRLWDVSGRLALEEKVAPGNTNEPHCFDLPPSIMPGFYAAEVIFPDGYQVVKKVVVGRR